ncbi:hypothetical protein [Candidatus Nitrosotalea okcheonensis]|uniref:GOLD domain-containing protein n=1 Tax=Candidatus Nitrosotalea okcheonensis TaxID=1903276 RepID=A0A2H1FF00_9ARCH|nr:hypothetical protein [Candidatus Nitrosotalea okcheonensis]SMH71333.1 protein of unknown function [Candidatus Nitrosotalea okcheonensis]
MKNQQLVKVLDQGRVSNTGNFHYTSSHDDTYFIIFSNEFSIISTKSVSFTYVYNGQQNHQSFTIPPGAFKSMPVLIHSGQSITGTFTASGGSGNDVDFNISTMTCTQTVNFSFSLSNTGQANGNADVAFEVDGKPVWSNNYSVDMGKQTSVSGSTSLSDCNPHDYKAVVTNQQRTR